jgi:hypothetical protein
MNKSEYSCLSNYIFFSIPTNLEEGVDSTSEATDAQIHDVSVVDWIRRVYDCIRSPENDGGHQKDRKMIIRVRK